MKKNKVSDHVKGNSILEYFREGIFYFKTDDTGFKFQIPLNDIEGATLYAKDKSIMFMRWIRKQMETNI